MQFGRIQGLGVGSVLMLAAAVLLSACTDGADPRKTRWDAYYAQTDTPRPHVVVVPPEGTTVPMAKLIAEYVAQNLKARHIAAQVGEGQTGRGRHFILTGVAEDNLSDPRVRYRRVLRWVLTDAGGRVIATHSQGVDGSEDEWAYGSARLLEAIGTNAAGPVSQMVLAETKAKTPIDPLQRGLLVAGVSGLADADAQLLADAVKDALRTSDILVTGDPRQAAFRLNGRVESTPAEGGRQDVRITWTVLTLDDQEVGRAVQENRLDPWQLQNGWGDLAPRVGAAAAVGVEHVFGLRAGPAPGAETRATGAPPAIVLPGVSGRAPPPPQ